MPHIDVKPKMFRWALKRDGHNPDALPADLIKRFPKLPSWIKGEGDGPTLKQLEGFAKAVHVPCGYMFFSKPPAERSTIEDFRTLDNRQMSRLSPNLLEMLQACRRRQDWYREFAQVNGLLELPFIGSVKIGSPKDDSAVKQAATDIRATLGFELEAREQCKTWDEALRFFIQQVEQTGIMVMVSGVVLSNTHRKLEVEEFRGFALVDRLAPLIFINGADSKSAQMFTLAHELAHLWINASGLSNAGARPLPELNSYRSSAHPFLGQEVWCNAVAAELLVPLDALTEQLKTEESIEDAKKRLARYFKVSTLVVLRRLLDAKWFSKDDFEKVWRKERSYLKQIGEKSGGGGNFYKTTAARVSRRFAQALICDTLEGKTLYRDAFRLLGVRSTDIFNGIGREVGIRNESLSA